VLVVDDDQAFRRHVAEVLAAGFEGEITIDEATDGRTAIQYLDTRIPDLLVLDLLMPAMDGFEVIRRLRADPRAANLPVLVVTAKDLTAQDRIELKRRMATLVRKQDASMDRIARTVHQHLGMRTILAGGS
jgi:CheY-like chemotaxis protein